MGHIEDTSIYATRENVPQQLDSIANIESKETFHLPSGTIVGGRSKSGIFRQITELTEASPDVAPQKLWEILSPCFDRFRVQSSRNGSLKITEVPINTPNSALAKSNLQKNKRVETIVVVALGENGTVNFSVENQTIAKNMTTSLVGENLSTTWADAQESVARMNESFTEFDDPRAGDFTSAQNVADKLGVCKTTIIRRIKDNRLLGYQGFKKDWLIPHAQFKDQNVVPGIAETISLFDNGHSEAWNFLSSKFFYGDEHLRPIDRLRALKHGDKVSLVECLKYLASVKSSCDYGDHF